MKEPSFVMVLCGVAPFAYRREDGVYVVPVTSLKDCSSTLYIYYSIDVFRPMLTIFFSFIVQGSYIRRKGISDSIISGKYLFKVNKKITP